MRIFIVFFLIFKGFIFALANQQPDSVLIPDTLKEGSLLTAAQAQENTKLTFNEFTQKVIKDDHSIDAHKFRFLFQFRQTYSFLKVNSIKFISVYSGVQYKRKHQFMIGFNVSTPWSWYSTIQRTFSNGTISATDYNTFYMYFTGLAYQYVILNNKYLKISFPLEAGYGHSYASITRDNGIVSFFYEASGDYMPSQIGIYNEVKITKWFGINGAIGYRVLLYQRAPVELNYDGYYYYFGLNIYVGNIYKSIRSKNGISND